MTDIEPGIVRTELLDRVNDPAARDASLSHWTDRRALESEDVARAMRFAVQAPPHGNVEELLLRPTEQRT